MKGSVEVRGNLIFSTVEKHERGCPIARFAGILKRKEADLLKVCPNLFSSSLKKSERLHSLASFHDE